MRRADIEEFFAAGRAASQSSDAEALHAFRIATKRLRYTIEILEPEGGEQRLAALRKIQEMLGEMNDAVVAAAYLRKLPKLSAKAKTLPARMRSEATAHRKRFRTFWTGEFDAEGEEAKWAEWATATLSDAA